MPIESRSRKLLCAFSLFAAAAFMPGPAHAAQTVQIGSLLETSGALASLGTPGLDGARLAVEEVNAAGGIHGYTFHLTNIDTESDTTKAVVAVKRLIGEDNVVGIIGGMDSGASYAITATVQRAGVPVIANGASRGIVLPPQQKTEMFLAPLTDVLVQSVMMKDMRRRGITKVALLNANSGFGTSGRQELEAHAKANGITLVDEQTFANSDKDMTPQLTKIRSSNAQATVIWATGPGQAIATKNYRQLGIKGHLYLSHAANDFNYIRLAGDAANGILIPSSKLYVVDTLPASDPQKAVNQHFVTAYKKKYGKMPATFAGNGYDAAMIMMRAIGSAGTDRVKVRAAIEATKGYVGVTAIYSYSPTDHFGAEPSSVVMLTVKDGAFALAK